ncbi:hypothetical protein BAUCODRAFT_575163 [Baudoinia panamericana UAMH 10762]|uniref:Uncharacterized protein n=1 Tax=Baudoinia panamericana (strain UAMH 10762) TaxID=717646 RepID=M2LS53_BAUPA|nr:uncharacterized protein BAUCODRAFT_575163 [Baudoinia panamericana UAMH 10762]EMC97297.1 hypothetical protein BAUCODRAFT_575163 [Baudoinia panamericana UAMH 10762]
MSKHVVSQFSPSPAKSLEDKRLPASELQLKLDNALTPKMSPPQLPDCVIRLRDGAMLATSAKMLGHRIRDENMVSHTQSLPIYEVDENMYTIRLLQDMWTGNLRADSTTIPNPQTLVALTGLCEASGNLSAFKPVISTWIQRLVADFPQHCNADTLNVAFRTCEKSTIVRVYESIMFAGLTDVEVYRADGLTKWFPVHCMQTTPRIRLNCTRNTVRNRLRSLLHLPLVQHPAMVQVRSNGLDAHHCVIKDMHLAAYLRALRFVGLLPLTEPDSQWDIGGLNERFRSTKPHLGRASVCQECQYQGWNWSTKLDAIEKSMDTILHDLGFELAAAVNVWLKGQHGGQGEIN